MASAVLDSRNDSSWPQSGAVFMGKQLPYSNHLNPNPNPNPIPKKKQLHNLGAQVKKSPAVVTSDSYSFNQTPIKSDFNHYVSFNLGSSTRTELIELKKRLISELEHIRRLNHLIESGKFQPRSKKVSGNKRTNPNVSNKDPKRLCQTTSSSDNNLITNNPNTINEISSSISNNDNLMKMCRQVLTKMLKHKHSWIFNKPVDAAALGLHDYHQIVKNPMDLGTVKLNFSKNLYNSPLEFASDVRLTFNNAMLYNPRGDEVHKMADQLLVRFEELYKPIQEKVEVDQKPLVRFEELYKPIQERVEVDQKPKKKSMPKPEKIPSPPVRTPSPLQAPEPPLVEKTVVVGRGNLGKQPKPKAKDPNKRAMSMEEKHKLGIGLQSLPQEKMPQLVLIIKKRNAHMVQQGDEIELDIEAIDTETLWELDRFVTNWKKMVSKNKRQALMVNNNINSNSVAATTSTATASEEDNVIYESEKVDVVKKPKKGEAGEEDVDIGDDVPMSSFPPVEIEKDDGVGHDKGRDSGSSTSSSSSGSDSSSSSDSDSGSSSGSDSDADEAQSRGLGSKGFSKT